MADNTLQTAAENIATDELTTINGGAASGGVKVQRVKIGHGADGDFKDANAAQPLPVDTEIPAAAALADGAANGTTPTLGSAALVYNGATWDRMRGDATNGIDVDVTRMPVATSAVVTNVAANAASVQLIAANTSRKALYIYNAGSSNLFIKLGTTATMTTSFTVMVPANGYYELPDDPIYTGRVDGIWVATGGNGALITELT